MGERLVDVLLTREHVILREASHSLWCSRRDGQLVPRGAVTRKELDSPTTLGKAWGCIGKIQFFSDAEWKLLLISHASIVGSVPQVGAEGREGGEGMKVYCIEQVAIVPLTLEGTPEVIGLQAPTPSSDADPSDPSALRPSSPTTGRRGSRAGREGRDREKLEKRLTEALLEMFNESRSFYFSWEGDLTQSLQRHLTTDADFQTLPPWQRVDERFFWNKWMLSDLIGDNYLGAIADLWVLPVIQGYVEVREIPVLRSTGETPDVLQSIKSSHDYRESIRKKEEMEKPQIERDVTEILSDFELVDIVRGRLITSPPGAARESAVELADGYESDSESSSGSSRDTDSLTDHRFRQVYEDSWEQADSEVEAGGEGVGRTDEDKERGGRGREAKGEIEAGIGEEGAECNDSEVEAEMKRGGKDGRELVFEVSEETVQGHRAEQKDPENTKSFEEIAAVPSLKAKEKWEEEEEEVPQVTGDDSEASIIEDTTRTSGSHPYQQRTTDLQPTPGFQTISPPSSSHPHSVSTPYDTGKTSIAPGGIETVPRQDMSSRAISKGSEQGSKGGNEPTIFSQELSRTAEEEKLEDKNEGEEEDMGGEDEGKRGGAEQRDKAASRDLFDSTTVPPVERTSPSSSESGIVDDELDEAGQAYGQLDATLVEVGVSREEESARPSEAAPEGDGGGRVVVTVVKESEKLEEEKFGDRTLCASGSDGEGVDKATGEPCPPENAVSQVHVRTPPTAQAAAAARKLRAYQDSSSEAVPDAEEGGSSVGEENENGRVEFGKGTAVGIHFRWSHWGEEEEEEEADGKKREGEERKEEKPSVFTLAIISRRSRLRAGTRYRRRGVDADGHVANYVETEMVLRVGSHQMSYVIVRGSVPVYWTQPGYKYRPRPIIEKGDKETREAFQKHFQEQLSLYREMAIVSLLNKGGRESVLADALENHVLLLDNPQLSYVTFDFHQHYKVNPHGGLKLLMKGIANLTKRFKFCWLDMDLGDKSLLCTQEGVFRVNCMDCLDRTNVAQSVISRDILQTALHKLNVLPFEEQLGEPALTSFKEVWANNGDMLSKQYTGTVAMKGDLTRYGERKFRGIMKDGYNSAHRYYQNLFRDTYRQVVMDLMQGCSPRQAFASLPHSMRFLYDESHPVEDIRREDAEEGEEDMPIIWSLDREQAIADLIQQCKQQVFPDKFLHVQCWAVIEAAGFSFVESSRKEEECVIMQCRQQSQLCIANYNSELEQVVCFIRIPMERIKKIVIGPLVSLLRTSKRLYMRLYYSLLDSKTSYFTFKTVYFTSMEEDRAILFSIATALSFIQPTITVYEQKLIKKRSPPHEGIVHLILPEDLTGSWSELDLLMGEEDSSDPRRGSSPRPVEAGSDFKIDRMLDEDELELSFSAPSSPKLIRRDTFDLLQSPHRLRSHSFDDILSNVNNEEVYPASGPTCDILPVPHSSARTAPLIELDSSSDSGSESDVESYELSTATTEAAEEDRSHKRDLEDSRELSQQHPVSQGGAFTRFKGRFLQKVKFGASKASSSQPHHGIGAGSGSTTSALSGQETEDSDVPTKRQGAQMFMSMGQKFRNSPSLLRKVGVNRRTKSPQALPPTSEDETSSKRQEARDKSQSTFVDII